MQLLRARVRNGEVSERALARLIGISQPHLHNILKGKRQLTPELTDRALYQLRMSLFDLVDRSVLISYLEGRDAASAEYSYMPVLSGRVGPTFSWPTEVEYHARFPLHPSTAQAMAHPVVVRAGPDVRMQPVIAEGDYLLLDQALPVRLKVDPTALYVIKQGRTGLVRRLREVAGQVYLVCEDAVERPQLWEKLPGEGASLLHYIRARAALISPEQEWPQPRAKDL